MAEPNKRVVVEAVDFPRLFYFPLLLKAITAAMQPGRLVIALLVVTALITFGRVWDAVAGPAVSPGGLTSGRWQDDIDGPRHVAAMRQAVSLFPNTGIARDDITAADTRTVAARVRERYLVLRTEATTPEMQRTWDERYRSVVTQIENTRPRGVFEATLAHVSAAFSAMLLRLHALDFHGTLAGLGMLLVQTPAALWHWFPWFTAIFGLFAMIVLAIGGGAIARMAAVQIGNHRRLTIREAFDFSLSHWLRLTIALLLPLLILILVRAVIAVMGLLMAAPVLDIIGGLIYGLALALGFVVAFLIVGYVVGAPMLVPAVAVENCDAADAMQRAYAYVVTRPLHLLGYWIVAVIALGIGFLIVGLIAALMLNSTASLYGTFNTHPALTLAGGYGVLEFTRPVEAPLMTWSQRTAAAFIGFWETLVISLVAAYVISFFFSAATILYLLMRRVCDGQDVQEVWMPGMIPGTTAPVPPPVSATTPAAP